MFHIGKMCFMWRIYNIVKCIICVHPISWHTILKTFSIFQVMCPFSCQWVHCMAPGESFWLGAELWKDQSRIIVLRLWALPTKLQRGEGGKFIAESQDFNQLCICNVVALAIPKVQGLEISQTYQVFWRSIPAWPFLCISPYPLWHLLY